MTGQCREAAVLLPAILVLKLGIEAEYWIMGTVPSAFYSNLRSPNVLCDIVLKMMAHVAVLTLLKALCSLCIGQLRGQLARKYCSDAFREYLASAALAACPFEDLEQRIFDDCRQRADAEVRIVERMLTPPLILYYSWQCWTKVAWPWALPIIYGFAAVSIVAVRAPTGWLKGALGAVEEASGRLRSELSWIKHNAEPIVLCGGQSWHLERLLMLLLPPVAGHDRLVGRVEALFEGVRTAVSYSGAAINYIIIVLYLRTSERDGMTAPTLSQYSFICLALINKIDESFGFVELCARRRLHLQRTRRALTHARTFALACARPPADRHHHHHHRSNHKQRRVVIDNLQISTPVRLSWTLSLDTHLNVNIVGCNGAGKSSILRALRGIWPIDRSRTVIQLPADLLVIPQGPFRFDADNWHAILSYPRCASPVAVKDGVGSDDNVRDCLQTAGLQVDRLPNSPGEWQRAHLARLLWQRPELAICDEPCSHMDDRHATLRAVMRRLAGTTQFVILSPSGADLAAADNGDDMALSTIQLL